MSERILQCVSGQSSITLRPKPKDLPADSNNTLRFRVSNRSGTELQDGLKQILQDLSWRLGLKVRMGGGALVVFEALPTCLSCKTNPSHTMTACWLHRGQHCGPGEGKDWCTTHHPRESQFVQVSGFPLACGALGPW